MSTRLKVDAASMADDADLLALGAKYGTLRERLRTMFQADTDAYAKFLTTRPKPPTALCIRKTDKSILAPYRISPLPSERRRGFYYATASELHNSIPAVAAPLGAVTRAIAIVEAYDAWREAGRPFYKAAFASVIPQDQRVVDAIYDTMKPLELAIISTPAHTQEGLMVKLRLLAASNSDAGGYDEEACDDERETISQRVAMSLVRDMHRNLRAAAVPAIAQRVAA